MADVSRVLTQPWGRGGMVDAADLKSVDLISRVGSSPTAPILKASSNKASTLEASKCDQDCDRFGRAIS